MRKLKFGLFGRIVVAILLGVGLGFAFAHCGAVGDLGVRTFKTFNVLFSLVLKFIVPLLILGLVTPAIADVGRGAGKMLLVVMALSYFSTVAAGFFAYGAASELLPHYVSEGLIAKAGNGKVFEPFFTLKIPPVCDVVTALVLAFLVGLGIVATQADAVLRAFNQFKAIVEWALAKAFVPLLPVYILTVTAELTASGRLSAVAGSAVKLALVCLAMNLAILVVQYLVAGVVARRNPFVAFARMIPAYLTGWGTCSSAATIPVTLRQVRQNGVSEQTANLVVPLCANVHLAGSMANVVAYSAGILALYGLPIELGPYTHFILMMSVVAVASPGVPGGCVLAAGAFVDSILGFTPEMYALMVAIYMALDGMGTACNLTGDGAIALIVDTIKRRRTL